MIISTVFSHRILCYSVINLSHDIININLPYLTLQSCDVTVAHCDAETIYCAALLEKFGYHLALRYFGRYHFTLLLENDPF